ncbi:Plexin-B [Eumeta japonica]|uniref:Plexin-B n=1 Tax=Eumeta variegata TaxID=151549 RepID=A0A4C1VHX4_EUMVA|nr:Plexin-B [Eumeta japonica]
MAVINVLFVIIIYIELSAIYGYEFISRYPNQQNETFHFYHLAIDKSSGQVYAGSLNWLHQLSPDLKAIHVIRTGPKLDNPMCHASGCTEPDEKTTWIDNVNKVLVIDQESRIVITCGSVAQGSCVKYKLVFGTTRVCTFQDAKISKAGSNLASQLGIETGDPVLVAVFSPSKGHTGFQCIVSIEVANMILPAREESNHYIVCDKTTYSYEEDMGNIMCIKMFPMQHRCGENDAGYTESSVLFSYKMLNFKGYIPLSDLYLENTPFSLRPSVHEVDLEWRHGRGGHVTLQDEDVTTKTLNGWRKLNTLAHYGVKESAVMSLISRQNDSFNTPYKIPCKNCTAVSKLPQVTDQELSTSMQQLSVQQLNEFDTLSALKELYIYVSKYREQIILGLEMDTICNNMHLAHKLKNVACTMEGEPSIC